MNCRFFLNFTLLGLVTLLAHVNPLAAQSNSAAQDSEKSMRQQSIAFPTGNRDTSVLLIETSAPTKARVNEQYTYEIHVTNIAQDLSLENVCIKQRTSKGIEVVDIQSGDQAKSQSNKEQQKSGGKQQDAGKQSSHEQADQDKNKDQKAQTNEKDQKNQKDKNVWEISRLMPGETKTAHITAVGGQEGQANLCLAVDYQTSACLAMNFVKPELAIEKRAPEQANLCDPIKYHYMVKNTGSGATEELTLTDPLPEGTHTKDGKQEVSFQIGSLDPNQSREFDVEIMATNSGEIASRAEAKTTAGLTARSNKPTTKVIEPKLTVGAQGPNVTAVGEPVTYQVTVKNEGDATAQKTRLAVEVPKGFDVLGASDNVNDDMRAPEKESGEALRVFLLGDLKPGDQKQFWIRTVAREPGKQLGYNFLASSECDRGRKERKPQRTVVRTEVIALPALMLTAVDIKDPVKSGEEVTYQINVVNQGSAPAKNVKVVTTLPAELQFANATGATAAKSEGNKVTFDPVQELKPHDKVEWRLTTKAQKAGQIRLHTEVTSDRIQQPGVSMEPTTVYDAQKSETETAEKPKETETK